MTINSNAAMLSLADADREGVGNKARRLAQLAQATSSQFSVLPGIVVRDRDIDSTALGQRVHAELGNGPFAVRSSAHGEDAADDSCAGRYLTLLDVDLHALADAVHDVFASYGGLAGGVLIQPMLRPDTAGVVFSRAPQNSALAALEYVHGTGDTLVSGQLTPQAVELGRFTGTMRPLPDGGDVPMCQQVFLAAALLEDFFAGPQDIEWASCKGELWILQSRDITATVDVTHVTYEQQAWVDRLASDRAGPRRLVASPTDELVADPTPMTRSLLLALYGSTGALGIALDQAALGGTTREYLHDVFGTLYIDPDVDRQLFGRSVGSWFRWARWRRTVHRDRSRWLERIRQRVDTMQPGTQTTRPDGPATIRRAASRSLDEFDTFVHEIYPTAFLASLLAQAAAESDASGSTTAELCHALSRLHHGRDLSAFNSTWGHRAALDYELACPRFDEDPAAAFGLAAQFADFPWAAKAEPAERSFTFYKELAKDRAIERLQGLRASLLDLAAALDVTPEEIFFLSIEAVREIAAGAINADNVRRMILETGEREEAWKALRLGTEINLGTVEWLEDNTERTGLRGIMLGRSQGFAGRVRLRSSDQSQQGLAASVDTPHEPIVLVTATLEPEIVGQFANTVGCITDVGGRLSHAAIVARELGYPVLTLAATTRTLHEGDWVEVSDTGRVQVRPSRNVETFPTAARSRELAQARR